jgi:hypothetical protein
MGAVRCCQVPAAHAQDDAERRSKNRQMLGGPLGNPGLLDAVATL